jgi:putative phosphoribosyl transferase
VPDAHVFADRQEAGRALGARLDYLRDPSPVVLALPRGGVPVAAEVADALNAPLDVILVRKLGVPSQPELGMGSIGEGGVRVINEEVVAAAGLDRSDIDAAETRERHVIEARGADYRRGRTPTPLEGRTAIIVDDGIATGSTALAATEVVRARGAARVVVAAPVASQQAVSRLAEHADEVICLETPRSFWAVGQWYEDFSQTTDAEVIELLETAAGSPATRPEAPSSTPSSAPTSHDQAPPP